MSQPPQPIVVTGAGGFIGRRLVATLALIEAVRDPEAPPRGVFASSIAVFGPPLPARVDDNTLPLPVMTYGAQPPLITRAALR